jgi:hypothetical protein
MILDDPPCSEIAITMCEDENDMLAISDDTLIHDSPIVFLNSPNHTIEEKYAYVENYLYGLQLSYACEIPICNHNDMIENGTSNYFERGKHDVGCHDNFSDPLCVLKYPMLLAPTDYMQWYAFVLFAFMIYKMSMHRKKVKFRCYCFYALCCSLSYFSLTIILIDLRTQWDLGVWCMEHFLSKEEGSKNCPHGMCNS